MQYPQWFTDKIKRPLSGRQREIVHLCRLQSFYNFNELVYLTGIKML